MALYLYSQSTSVSRHLNLALFETAAKIKHVLRKICNIGDGGNSWPQDVLKRLESEFH